jgi:hypothetical protein
VPLAGGGGTGVAATAWCSYPLAALARSLSLGEGSFCSWWAENGGKGARLVGFALETSKGSMHAKIWDGRAPALHCLVPVENKQNGVDQVHARRRTSNETAVCVVPSWARAVAPLDYSTALLCRDVHQRGSVPRSVLVRAPSSCKPRYETAAEPVINGPVWRSSASPVELFF